MKSLHFLFCQNFINGYVEYASATLCVQKILSCKLSAPISSAYKKCLRVLPVANPEYILFDATLDLPESRIPVIISQASPLTQ